jgi:hypothetical protein
LAVKPLNLTARLNLTTRHIGIGEAEALRELWELTMAAGHAWSTGEAEAL